MRRLPSLDILRGFALCGILFANAPAILRLDPIRDGSVDPVLRWLEFGVYHRFFPLFALLFGIGFALMWRSARERARSPRIVMLRRVLAIGALGAAHQLLQPGEALLPYAIVALVLLLPATFLPDRFAAPVTGVLGAVSIAAAATVSNGLLLVPGLFLLGFAASCAGLPQWLAGADGVRTGRAGAADGQRWAADCPAAAGNRPRTGALVLALLVLAPAGAAALLWQSADPEAGVVAGLIMAAVYGCVVLLALHTRPDAAIGRVLTALGRTALTNYLAATLMVVAARYFAVPLGLDPLAPGAWARTLALCVLILVAQAAVSLWWLGRFAQGPVEWLLRRVSWAGMSAAAPTVPTVPATTAPDTAAVSALASATPPVSAVERSAAAFGADSGRVERYSR
ncbi:DUF418 domain-containing protein [Nocardia sp. NPDC058058]|uniref:DUF418 domain-containing protein n=1 Tax=Nocardia sp. NPDC058058 TaxID=3346317 RepID=UPI0036D943CC